MTLRKARRRAAEAQNHRCWYCGLPMWEGDPAEFARTYGITVPLAHRLQCTAEHQLARRDGGKDAAANIVAACQFCNHERHHRRKPFSSEQFRDWVRRRLARHRWHPEQLHALYAR